MTSPSKTTILGNSGLSVSRIAWGMWRFAGDDVPAAQGRIEAAFAAGVTLFDTADIYGPDNGEPFGAAEALLGRVFAAQPGLRDRMVLATKGGIRMGVPYDSSGEYIREAIDASLRRLRTNRVELWQIHRPDLLAHPQETARALDDAVTAGKIAAVGVSNFTPTQTRALAHFLNVPLASTQPEFSPLTTKPLFDGTMDGAMTHGRRFWPGLPWAAAGWPTPATGARVTWPRCWTQRQRRQVWTARRRVQLDHGAPGTSHSDCRHAKSLAYRGDRRRV